MITTNEWLPIGSVVHLEGTDGLIMITTAMVGDTSTNQLWDYAGVSYPIGKARADDDVMFDRNAIDGIFYVGFQDEDGERYQDGLRMATDQFEQMKRDMRGTER